MRENEQNKETERAVPLSFSLPAREADALRERARLEDRSISSLVRLALRRVGALEEEHERVAS